jgi:hypothetical protein
VLETSNKLLRILEGTIFSLRLSRDKNHTVAKVWSELYSSKSAKSLVAKSEAVPWAYTQAWDRLPLTKEITMVNLLVRWLIFLHILAALTFFLAHGASAAMAFKIRKETDFTRIGAMLDLSWSTMILMGVSFLVMGLTGIILPFLIRIWNKGYIWASIVLMLFVFIYMAMFNETTYKQLRRLVGLPYMKGSKEMPAEPPANPEAIIALLQKTRVTGLVVVGYIIPAIVLWLMIFKPF